MDKTDQEVKTNREIANELGFSSADFKRERTNVKNEEKALRLSQILELQKKGWSTLGVARIINISEWTVRKILNDRER
jgi:hypothetical protein